MNFNDYQGYFLPVLLVGFFAWRFYKFRLVKRMLPKFLENGGIVVDVRTPAEFSQGSRPGSINIPFNEIHSRAKELDLSKPIILCCASGTRSGMAATILKRHGFKTVINAGAWTNTLVS